MQKTAIVYINSPKKNLQTIYYINEGGDVTLTIVGRVRSGCWEASSSRSAMENKEFRFF